MDQGGVSGRLAVTAIDAEVVAGRDAPLELPLDLFDAAPAIALEQLRDPPLCCLPVFADGRPESPGREGSKPTVPAA